MRRRIEFHLPLKSLALAAALITLMCVVMTTSTDTISNLSSLLQQQPLNSTVTTIQDNSTSAAPPPEIKRITIKDKVAVITDTRFTARHIPLILHFHTVLGNDWPIVYYTSQEVIDEHLEPKNGTNKPSAIWTRAVKEGRIEVRLVPPEFDLGSRDGVNLYMSDPWLWEQLAPAQKVLVFQSDAIICANAHNTVDDFLQWDFIGATLVKEGRIYNGGLSLRNRVMMLDIISEGSTYAAETKSGNFTKGGEDVWFSIKMDQRGANLPDSKTASEFACEYAWHVETQKASLGYHKIHKAAHGSLEEIAAWCPEIALAAPGALRG
ncbi:hypothetical protein H072_230 [Dactylellina haptotyla CBS 200.50]|uniref:DUF5672 domain-containing protein n=1 Tax=Dactylellina haptotyla (strain CBS 200.50) TaxID=1284197 RepID=S8C2E9_DACHA|nr:hypothetical protein H072_230 [Dactylellina haptotyla CBS 200.50]